MNRPWISRPADRRPTSFNLSQTINNTVAGVTYTISFWVAENGTNGPSTLNVLWNGTTAQALTSVVQRPAASPTSSSTTVNVIGTGAPTTLEFDVHNQNAFILDDISDDGGGDYTR